MSMAWSHWLLALHRPPQLDDEEVPVELDLVPWWQWAMLLRQRSAADVEHVTPRATQEATQLVAARTGPAPTDGCCYRAANGIACDGSCERKAEP